MSALTTYGTSTVSATFFLAPAKKSPNDVCFLTFFSGAEEVAITSDYCFLIF